MIGIELLPGPNRVHAVLEQLADIDLGAAIEVVREEVDDPSKVYLELIVHEGAPGQRFESEG